MKKHTKIPGDMSVLRPYMIEAFYKWICGNHMTPLIAIDTNTPETRNIAPDKASQDHVLVLDLAPDAVDDLVFGPVISVCCHFDRGPKDILIPVSTILAIYSQENQEGLFFKSNEIANEEQATLIEEERQFFENLKAKNKNEMGPSQARSRMHLQIVKASTALTDSDSTPPLASQSIDESQK